MDLAYDHITQSTLSPNSNTPSRSTTPTPSSTSATNHSTNPLHPSSPPRRQNLQEEFLETYSNFKSSEWGARVGGLWANAGGLWGNVRKQGETYLEEARRTGGGILEEARKEVGELKDDVIKEVEKLGLLGDRDVEKEDGSVGEDGQRGGEGEDGGEGGDKDGLGEERREGDIIVSEFLTRFKGEAAKALQEVHKAEDAADEALLRFGSNIRNFLRDAVKIAPPADDTQDGQGQPGAVLFESRDNTGKRVIHTSRLDAQLHVLHTSEKAVLEDPEDTDGKWEEWKSGFDSGSEEVSARVKGDLERYPELRRRMEQCVPEKVEYAVFWARYYFVRRGLESQEERRREMLKASADETEEVGWDDEEEEEDETTDRSTPQINEPKSEDMEAVREASRPATAVQDDGLKPEGRRSHDEKSVADSDASYDLVSGTQSRAPSSPKEDKAGELGKVVESDEEDWE